MADKNDGGDKTEAPTQKRIADARTFPPLKAAA